MSGPSLRGLFYKAAKTAFAAADLLHPVPPGPRILIYHQFDAGLGREMEVSTRAFSAHLDWYQTHGDIVSLEEALTRRTEPDAHRLFVLTLDDGYHDQFARAFPLLLARKLPFTLYLTTDPVEGREALTPGGRAEPLTWDRVNQMLDSGLMTLGAHTHTHQDLRGLTREETADELDRSNRLIEQRTGVAPRHFAYPKGIWVSQAEPLVRSRYETAVLGAGEPIIAETDIHRLTRVPVQRSDGVWLLKRKAKRGLRLEEHLRRRLRGYEAPADGLGPMAATSW